LLTISAINADYKLGKDYKLVDNPMPVKKDGIVEVTEVILVWMRSLLLI